MTRAKVLLDSCIWSGAKQDLTDASYDVKWVGDFFEDPGDEVAGQVSRDILDKYFAELEHHAIITVERDRVRIRVAEY